MEFWLQNPLPAQSSMSAASQIRDAILEKRIADVAVFERMMGAATD
jgi:hypothetical protein